MMLPGVCDSTQAQPDPNEVGPTFPSLSRSNSHAAVVGTIEEAVSRHPLRGGTIDLGPADSTSHGIVFQVRVPTDRFGGFALDSIPPGQYLITARRIGYQPIQRRVTLVAGRVDSATFIMRRYSCVGY
jgi:hypothetical protein